MTWRRLLVIAASGICLAAEGIAAQMALAFGYQYDFSWEADAAAEE